MKEIRRVSVIGLGAIGCFVAGKLQKALPSEALCIIAGGKRKEKLEAEGVIINDQQTFFHVVDPEQSVEPADLIIIATKFNQLEDAVRDIRNHVGEETVIMSLLNGIESEEVVARVYGQEKVLYSLIRVSSMKEGNKVHFTEGLARIEFGEKVNQEISERVRCVSQLFDHAQIGYLIQPDMVRAIWLKYMANVSENQSSAILGIPFGAWRKNEHANFIREKAMREVIAIGQKSGVDISEEDLIRQRETFVKINPNGITSMLQDINQKRRTEVEMFAGTIIRLGRELGIETPVNEIFYHSIRTLEDKNEGKFIFE